MGGEIFAGEAGKVASTGVSESVKSAFGAMRFIVTVGWSIYPLGYFFGYLCGAVAPSALNLIYNLADFVNKIAFCLVIWHLAKSTGIKEPLRAPVVPPVLRSGMKVTLHGLVQSPELNGKVCVVVDASSPDQVGVQVCESGVKVRVRHSHISPLSAQSNFLSFSF